MLTEPSQFKHIHKLDSSIKIRVQQAQQQVNRLPAVFAKPLYFLKSLMARHRVIVQVHPAYFQITGDNSRTKKLLGCKVKHSFGLIDSFATTVNTRNLQKLAAHRSVVRIWHDEHVQALLNTAVPTVGATKVWADGNRGQGIGIAVIDTGIMPHPDLTSPTNRIIAFKDFVRGRRAPYDDNGHGTHCAGDAAGSGFKSIGKYAGPAPQARLIGVKVLDKKGAGRTSTLIAGIKWCIDNKTRYGIRILSLSLGSTARQSAADDPACRALAKAWESGLVVCAAAGNDGPGPRTINSPGIEPKVITVGASDDRGSSRPSDDTVASFSSRGPTIDGLSKPDLLAPGVNIVSLRTPNSYIDKTAPSTRVGEWYASMSGTSMATPICAGLAALLLSSKPNLTPDGVKKALLRTCRSLTPGTNADGAGLADVYAAVNQISKVHY